MITLDRLPVQGPITQEFGIVSVTGSIHAGLDIACPTGTPVYAPAAGEVVDFVNSWTIWNGERVRSYGIGVCLKHTSPDETLYSLCAHLSRADVALGERVSSGQQIGLSGSTGVSTGGHVHFQLSRTQAMPNGTAQNVDPLTRLAPEEEDMTPEFRGLQSIAWGDYDRMNQCYEALADAGLVPIDPFDGDLNEALVRRFTIAALSVADNARAAYVALVGG